MINLRKVVNTIYIGIRDTHPRYIKLLYFYISYIEFHIFVYPPIIGKRIPVLLLPGVRISFSSADVTYLLSYFSKAPCAVHGRNASMET